MMPMECGIEPKAKLHVRPVIYASCFDEEDEALIHYGVPGQKWGVITKEYEPVAIDHRRTGNNPNGISGRIKQRINDRRNEARAKDEKFRAEIKANYQKQREQRQKIAKYGAIGVAALAGLLIAYGTYKYVHVNKMKAYSGLLNRFMRQNPQMNLNDAAGRAMFKSGVEKAAANSRSLKDAVATNRYLKRTGLQIGKSEARRMYSARHLINRLNNMKTTGGKYGAVIDRYRRNRLQAKIFDKIYF